MTMFRRRRRGAEEADSGVERIPEPTPSLFQPQTGPFPMAQQAGGAYHLPNTGRFDVVPNGMPMNLPRYTSIDEYGRAYTPLMSYAPQPNSSPVPIATPSRIVQLNPIVSPVAFVPYTSQRERLYQMDEDV